MRRVSKIFIAYFPVMLLAGQVMANWLYFIAFDWYIKAGFYLNLFFGTNVFFAMMLVTLTHFLNFCKVSRWAAWAQLAFAINYMIVKQDNLYNIIFQVIIGTIALLFTFRHYIVKYPNCNFSVGLSVLSNAVKDCSCEKSIEKHSAKVERAYYEKRHH